MIQLPNPDSITDVADWVELHTAVSKNSFSKLDLASVIEGATGEEPLESFITSVWRELERRERLYLCKFFRC